MNGIREWQVNFIRIYLVNFPPWREPPHVRAAVPPHGPLLLRPGPPC